MSASRLWTVLAAVVLLLADPAAALRADAHRRRHLRQQTNISKASTKPLLVNAPARRAGNASSKGRPTLAPNAPRATHSPSANSSSSIQHSTLDGIKHASLSPSQPVTQGNASADSARHSSSEAGSHPVTHGKLDTSAISPPRKQEFPWEWPTTDLLSSHELAAAAALVQLSYVLEAHHWLYGREVMLDMVINEMRQQADEAAAEALAIDELSNSPDDSPTEKLTDEQLDTLREQNDDIWVFAGYRKSGCHLARNILNHTASNGCSWHEKVTSSIHSPWEALDTGDRNVFTTMDFSNHFCNPDMHLLQAIPRYRLVHIVRDPFELVASSYRYHRFHTEGWLKVPVQKAKNLQRVVTVLQRFKGIVNEVPAAHQKTLAAFARSVHEGGSLQGFYETMPAADGLIVEAYRSWPEVELLMNNLQFSRADNHALQVRVESIERDFTTAMQCVFTFLNESRWLHVDRCLSELTNFSYLSSPEDPRNRTGDSAETALMGVNFMTRAREVYTQQAVREC